jgi:hypothetical protein
MLSSSHDRAYQDFLILLTKLQSLVCGKQHEVDPIQVKQEFDKLSLWFERHITNLHEEDLSEEISLRWQSVQTEIKREFKLLSTDILFLASARQNTTQNKRLKNIGDRLSKLINYCQIMLNSSNAQA